MATDNIEQYSDSSASLQDKIDLGRLLGSEILGGIELTDRESLIVRTVYSVAYSAGVESTAGIDFSDRERTIISAVSQEMLNRLKVVEVVK